MTYLDFIWNDIPLKIDSKLAEALASLVYNINADWDFVIIVTGERTTRTGKSVLAMTICAFLAYVIKKLGLNENAFNENNIFFDAAKMMDGAQDRPKYSVIQMDEARESLAASKTMQMIQQNLLDFFTECGQLNNIFVVVLPDFFDLKETIAVPRSEFLVNVYRDSSMVQKDFMGDGIKRPVVMYHRGQFKFYNRDAKSMMYDYFRTTRRKDYRTIKPSFPPGSFMNQYAIPEKMYREMKAKALTRFKEAHAPKINKNELKAKIRLDRALALLEEKGVPKSHVFRALQITKTAYNLTRGIEAKNKEAIDLEEPDTEETIFDKKSDTGYVDNT